MEGFTIESFLGSFFILIFFVFILYGIFCAQVYHYYATYRDPLALKLVVLLLCVLESLHAAACMHMLYSYLVLFVTEPAKELTIIWSVAAIIFLEHTIGVTVQLYYIYRLWKVSQSLVILLVLVSAVIYETVDDLALLTGKIARCGSSSYRYWLQISCVYVSPASGLKKTYESEIT
ncbi:hypothetical protein BC629DRAFT_82069 [Irpex lacteus]|nr:hypothetical protein BC629DRAFT_82069 [Irpex lacteus]